MTAAVAHSGTVLPGQELHCFVCDVAVSGRYYTLATCRTQTSKVRLIEKLGQIVGERYMVIISEDDIICRGCASLINTLDRLETEMGSVRSAVLRFLEKKYSLSDGELVNSKPTGAPAPSPQITPSTNPGRDHKSDLNRKRKDISTDGESDGEFNSGSNKKKSKSDTWMQCNKCKYTTDYQAFMVHHVRQSKKKAPVSSSEQDELCGEKQSSKKFKPNAGSHSNNHLCSDGSSVKTLDSGDAETVEMIAAEISDLQGTHQKDLSQQNMVITTVSHIAGHESNHGATSLVVADHGTSRLETIAAGTENGEEVTIEVSGMVMQGVEGEAMCMMPITDEGTGEHDEAGDGNVYVHVVDMSGEEVGRIPAGSVGTVGRVNEDGTVEMVEVMWDQMVSATADGDPDQAQFTLE